VLIMMGANLIRFLLDVDGARSFAHELIDCCVSTSFYRNPSLPPLIETSARRDSVPAWGRCMPPSMPLPQRTAHVRVQVLVSVDNCDMIYWKNYVGGYSSNVK
jgi:hypothetical protein